MEFHLRCLLTRNDHLHRGIVCNIEDVMQRRVPIPFSLLMESLFIPPNKEKAIARDIKRIVQKDVWERNYKKQPLFSNFLSRY